MIDLQIVADFAHQNLEKVTTQKGGTHFHARCPLCGDSKKSQSKKRFHLDWNNGNPGYHCFNCNATGNFIKLYSLLKGISEEEVRREIFKYNSDYIKKKLTSEPIVENMPSGVQSYNYILNSCVTENTESILLEYWKRIISNFRNERKIPEQYKLYYCFDGRYKNRIIVPVFKENDIIYFQARRVPGTKLEPKYLNPSTEKQIIIHNEENFDKDKFIIITEGLIDAFMIGDQGTSCLGKEISEDFLSKLFELTDKGIIIALDNDSDGMKALDIFIEKNAYKQRCRYFLMPEKYKYCKDINDVKTKHNIENLYEFIVNGSYSFVKTYLKVKMLRKGKLED